MTVYIVIAFCGDDQWIYKVCATDSVANYFVKEVIQEKGIGAFVEAWEVTMPDTGATANASAVIYCA